jgi:hypothetical protein
MVLDGVRLTLYVMSLKIEPYQGFYEVIIVL